MPGSIDATSPVGWFADAEQASRHRLQPGFPDRERAQGAASKSTCSGLSKASTK